MPVRAVIGDPVPAWLKPENASVFDNPMLAAIRWFANAAGLNDPNAAVMGMAAPMEVGPGGGIAEIIAKAHGKFKQLADKEFAERANWVRQVEGPNANPGEPMTLPGTFSATKAAKYITRYFDDWKSVFKSQGALVDALREGNTAVGRGKLYVPYDAGRASASGFPLIKPLGYDKFSREDIDSWIANLLNSVGEAQK